MEGKQATTVPTNNGSIQNTQEDTEGPLILRGYECCDTILGKGTFATVRLAYSTREKKNVAIKIVDKRTRSQFNLHFLPRELDIVQKVDHFNIVKVYEVIESGPIVYMVEEFGENGDLLTLISKSEVRRLREDQCRFFFRQLIEALKYLKSINVAHRDVKCENIFLDGCDNVKLGDFGFSREIKDDELSRTFCGSKAYVAPEILQSKPYSGHAGDLWSAGVVLFVMITGYMPYDDKNITKMLEKQLKHKLSFPKKVPLSDSAKRLIFDILHPVPEKRRQYPAIIRSTWLYRTAYFIKTEPARKAELSGPQSAGVPHSTH